LREHACAHRADTARRAGVRAHERARRPRPVRQQQRESAAVAATGEGGLMDKSAPSVPRIITMVVFALSCFGLLIFLWISFGGSVPLKPKAYEVHVHFPEATTLAEQADVRMAGVTIGKVRRKELDKGGARTNVTLDIEPKYAPIPSDTRAILRQKTLLGETYVELSPGSRTA